MAAEGAGSSFDTVMTLYLVAGAEDVGTDGEASTT